MIKRILVPLDFSECSINALKYAAQLSKKLQVECLQIMHAYSSPVSFSEAGINDMESIDTLISTEINERFEQLKSDIPELKDLNYEFNIENAFIIEALQAHNYSEDNDLIIMGTKGATGLEEVFFGSTTYAAIQSCKSPVLVIPAEASYKHINNMAFASDYKAIDTHVLEPLKFLNKAFLTNIHIVHISEAQELTQSEVHEAKKYEQYFHKIPHQFHYVVANNVEKGLTEYVKTHKIDMVAVLPRKHSFFEKIFGLGNSKPIIFHTHLPLLVLPEK